MKKSTSVTQKKVGLYDPFIDVMGGGERHILSILQVLESQGYEISIFWDKDLSSEIQSILQLQFHSLTFTKNVFHSGSPYQRLQELQKYDMFFYVTDGSYFVSSAKKTYIFCMVPDKKLYNMNFVNKAKTTKSQFISNSIFTNKWLEKWNIHSSVIHPYISDEFIRIPLSKHKEKIILNVGRFFPHLHAKRQDIAIDWFMELNKKHVEFKDYSLHLAGTITKQDQDYFKELRVKSAHDPSIVFHENIPFHELIQLYTSAEYYWHFAGYEVDEEKNPEKTEHLGITPLEAMASGCITFAYNAGGPKELIFNGRNGFLFQDQSQLFFLMDHMQKDSLQKQSIMLTGKKFVQDNFSYEIFAERVKEVLL